MLDVTIAALDTIKVRMQLSRKGRGTGERPRGFFATGAHIVRRESPLGLYKGLGAVLAGIVPKMAIRFMSFEQYKGFLANRETGVTSAQGVFFAGLLAGITEAVAVVNPMEVVKIRLQAQQHSLADPMEKPRYHNAAHALYTIVREEGFLTLYRGVALTAARQATNQAANFTAYQELKALAQRLQGTKDLPSYETATIGLISGALGPFSNAPIDTIKTRIQRATKVEGETAVGRVMKGTYTTLLTRQSLARCLRKRASAPSGRASRPVSPVSPPVRLSCSRSTKRSRVCLKTVASPRPPTWSSSKCDDTPVDLPMRSHTCRALDEVPRLSRDIRGYPRSWQYARLRRKEAVPPRRTFRNPVCFPDSERLLDTEGILSIEGTRLSFSTRHTS